MRDGDLDTAWCLADAALARRQPGSRNDPGLPYHQRWVWDGRCLDGQHVVVRCYHGLGDTLQFARFIPALAARAATVTLEVQPELLPLLARCGATHLIPFDPGAPTAADCDIEIMELQHALRLPPPMPSLRVTPGRHRGTGVCWRAGGWDPRRSIPLDLLRPALPSDAISLQRGERGLPDPLDGCMDIAATARLIAGLDRVVTVDSMVAHLAGSLGRPVHLLLQHGPDWRWGRGDRTPWYPTARLYRQSSPGDWSGPIDALAKALRAA